MNVALGAVFILYLLSPGFAIRYAFLKGPYSRQNFKPSFSDELFWSIIPAFIIHLCGLIILDKWFHIQPPLDTLYYLMTNVPHDNETVFDNIRAGMPVFLNYSAITLLIAGMIGFLARKFVISMKWDQKFSMFKINNEWYYLLTGKILEGEQKEWVDFVQIDALVKTSEGDFIYCGILENFILTQEGGLDRLYMANVYRRKLKNDVKEHLNDQSITNKKFDDRYYNMPGQFFILPYKDVINMNISYYKITEVE